MEGGIIENMPPCAVQYANDPDLALVHATIGGDMHAFETLVQRYSGSLLRIADQVTRNLDDAQEAVQDAFFKTYKNLHKFQGNSKFSTWLTRIALNESIGILRKRRSCRILEIPLDFKDSRADGRPLQIADWHPNPEQLFDQVEIRRILREALLKLRPTLRIVFVLREIEDLSVVETATILELAPSTVKVRLHRARLQLRDILSRYFCKSTLQSRHTSLSQFAYDAAPHKDLEGAAREAGGVTG